MVLGVLGVLASIVALALLDRTAGRRVRRRMAPAGGSGWRPGWPTPA